MNSASGDEEQLARQLPRYLRSRARSEFKKKIANTKVEFNYQEMKIMGKIFGKEEPQRGMKIINERIRESATI
jgi:hypothetical protein